MPGPEWPRRRGHWPLDPTYFKVAVETPIQRGAPGISRPVAFKAVGAPGPAMCRLKPPFAGPGWR